jgi:hypothetical protein
MLAVALVLVRAHSSIIHEPYYSIIRHLHCCSGTMFFLINRAFVSAHQNATTKDDEDVNEIRHKTMSSFLLDAHIDGRKIGIPPLDIALSLQTKEKTANKTNIYIYICISLFAAYRKVANKAKKIIYLFMLPERWTQEDVFAASLRVVSHDLMKFVKNWSV